MSKLVEKLRDAARIVSEEVKEPVTESDVAGLALADWHGAGHRDWLDGADAQEIAEWFIFWSVGC